MNPKILAKLAAKASGMDPSIPATDKSGMTQADVAASLAGTHRGAVLLIRVKWAHEVGLCDELVRLSLAEASKFAYKWKKSKHMRPGLVRSMITIALEEVINPRQCGKCSGRGIVYKKFGVVEECRICEGTGRKSRSMRSIAGELDIPRESWRREWRFRYVQIVSMLNDWENEALRNMSKRLN